MSEVSDAITRLNAALEGRYRIESELGEGGMAMVYLADDLKHERKVALKVLKPELAAVVGADRFLTEIKTTANLQHPHILPLFDSGEADGFLFYVMPFVEGETLRDRLDREKQLPIEEAVRIATDVAEALHSAHQQGVIHRDIKPANILLSKGRPLVADFGIALAVSAAGGGRLTETGMSLGTPYYMSPEQASADREPGATSDVYSLGCVLYEMLVGDPPHTASSAQAVLAKILTEDARAPTAVRTATPPNVDAAIRRAIEKLPADRFRGADDFAKALADRTFSHGSSQHGPGVATSANNAWKRLALATTALAGVLAVVAAWGWLGTTEEPSGMVIRARIDHAASFGSAISSDGGTLAFVERAGPGERRVFVRRVDELESRPVLAATGAGDIELSPNGGWMVFSRADSILKVNVADGTVLPLVGGHESLLDETRFRGAGSLTWSASGTIWYTTRGGLWTIPENGGEPTHVYAPLNRFLLFAKPTPSGRVVILTETSGSLTDFGVSALDVQSGTVVPLVDGARGARVLSTGHLVYAVGRTLFAVVFDERSKEIVGEPSPVMTLSGSRSVHFEISETGTALYAPELATGGTLGLSLVDTLGQGAALPIPADDVRGIRFSPDGRRLAYGAASHVWVFDRALGARVQLSEAPGYDPVWSADGDSVTYHSRTASTVGWDGFRRSADGSGPEEQLFALAEVAAPQIWLADGRLLARGPHPERRTDLHVLEFGDSLTTTPFLRADWDEYHPAVSPNERWLLYVSDQDGEPAVWVRPLDDQTVASTRLSTAHGAEPAWHPDGDRVYYWEDTNLIQVVVRAEDRFEIVSRSVLFSDPGYVPSLRGLWANYDVDPDGGFVMARRFGGEVVEPYMVLAVNWFEELRERMRRD